MSLTISQAIKLGKQQLKDLDSPYLNSRLLLQHVTQLSHSQILAYPERELQESEDAAFRALLIRAAVHEPVPYLVGSAPFYGYDFYVNPSVLIPRPETELLVEYAVDWIRRKRQEAVPISIVDVGTGSGCIAIVLAAILPKAVITAVDISISSLLVARRNARSRKVENRIAFIQGDLLSEIDFRPDLIVANLPYIADSEWSMLDPGVQLFEPEVALRGGRNGMIKINELLLQAREKLAPGGAIFLEIGWQQGSQALELAESHFPHATISVKSDLSDLDRILIIRMDNES